MSLAIFTLVVLAPVIIVLGGALGAYLGSRGAVS
jgi:hypothetical protein